MARSSETPRLLTLPKNVASARICLIVSVVILSLLGLLMVYSASSISDISEGVSPETSLLAQLRYAAIGIILAFLIWRFVPYQAWFSGLAWIVWGVCIVFLIVTAVVGSTEYGATRWLSIGGFGFQPSEFIKIGFVLFAAKYVSDFREGNIEFKALVLILCLCVLIPLIVLAKTQSDLGSTIICVVGVAAVMYLGEIPTKFFVGLIAVGAVLVFIAIFASDYRTGRLVFLNPWDDGDGGYGSGYNIIRSYYAFAEGGLTGVGLGNSHEKYAYLFAADSDFIYAVIGEELGLVGALIVMALYVLFLYAVYQIVQSAPNNAASMIAGGLGIMLVFQAFLNMGCAIGVFPTTGKPLPFISSGGSSIIASFIIVGIILSVSRASGVADVYQQRREDLRVLRRR